MSFLKCNNKYKQYGKLTALERYPNSVRSALVAMRKPEVFVFSLYAATVPFNQVVFIEGYGTVVRYLLLLAIGMLSIGHIIIRRGHILRPPLSAWIWVAFVVLAGTSVIWASDPDATVRGVSKLVGLLFLYLLATTRPWRDTEYNVVIWSVVLGGSIAAILSIRSFILVEHIKLISRARLFLGEERIADPNHLAISLLLPFIFAMWLSLSSRGITRVISIVSVSVLGTCIVMTGSRGGLIGFLYAVSFFLFRYIVLMKRRRKSNMLMGIILIAMIFALIFMFSRQELIARYDVNLLTEASLSSRLDIWRQGFSMLMEKPLIGYGYNNFLKITGWLSHNIYLQSFAELGLIGGLLILLALFVHWPLLQRAGRQDSKRIPLEAAFVGIIVGGISLHCLHHYYFWMVFTLIGVYINMKSIHRSSS